MVLSDSGEIMRLRYNKYSTVQYSKTEVTVLYCTVLCCMIKTHIPDVEGRNVKMCMHICTMPLSSSTTQPFSLPYTFFLPPCLGRPNAFLFIILLRVRRRPINRPTFNLHRPATQPPPQNFSNRPPNSTNPRIIIFSQRFVLKFNPP